MNLLKVPSTISKVATMADGGLRLNLDTQELPPEEMSVLMSLKGKFGWMVFSETGVTEVDIPTEKVDFKGDKTPGQRMRAVLYRLWEQSSDPTKGDFEFFYKTRMERLIENIKQKLE